MPHQYNKEHGPAFNPKAIATALMVVMLCGLGFFLKIGISIPVKTAAPHDSELFFNWTRSLIAGQWLGAYNELTLTKGPMMSIVAAFSNKVHAPYKLVEYAVYVLAIFATTAAVYRATRSSLLTVALAALLAINPSLWSGEARVFMREPLYFVFALLTLSLLMLDFQQKKFSWFTTMYGLLAGLSFGGYWYTREESIWIYPSLAVLFSSLWLSNGSLISKVQRSAKHSLVFLFGFSVVSGIVVYSTWTYYDTLTTNVFRQGAFREAMGSLQRIDAPSSSPYVPVSKQALTYAEKISPAAAQVAPLLKASPWAKFGSDLPEKLPDEISGASFAWALLSAAASKGFHASAQTAERFYQSLSQDIELACEQSRIPCKPLNTGMMPRMALTRIPDFLISTIESLNWIIFNRTAAIDTPAWSSDHRRTIDLWRATLGSVETLKPAFSEKNKMHLSGWIASNSLNKPAFSAPASPSLDVTTHAAPDVERHLAELDLKFAYVSRYVMEAECDPEDCVLEIGGKPFKFSTLGPTSISEIKTPEFTIHIDKATFFWTEQAARSLLDPEATSKLAALEKLRIPYGYLISTMSLLGLLGVALYGFFIRQHPQYSGLWLFSLAVAGAVVVRAAMVGYIDTTSWHAINVRNLLPAYGFAVIFACCGTFLWVKSLGFALSAWRQRAVHG
ncbi:MAG: hypothetical protein WCZ20_10910 [Hydrogenophaga sp.]